MPTPHPQSLRNPIQRHHALPSQAPGQLDLIPSDLRRNRKSFSVHQAWPVGFGAGFGEGRRKAPPLQVVVVNRFAPVPPVHDVIDRPGILQSEFARHAPSLSAGGESLKQFLQ